MYRRTIVSFIEISCFGPLADFSIHRPTKLNSTNRKDYTVAIVDAVVAEAVVVVAAVVVAVVLVVVEDAVAFAPK